MWKAAIHAEAPPEHHDQQGIRSSILWQDGHKEA